MNLQKGPRLAKNESKYSKSIAVAKSVTDYFLTSNDLEKESRAKVNRMRENYLSIGSLFIGGY